MKRIAKSPRILLSLGAVVILNIVLVGLAGASGGRGAPTPDNFDGYLVYMADGVYDPADPEFTPPDGEFFQREIMGRTDAQIAEREAEAKAFFEQRFGLDPDDPDLEGRIRFGSGMFDPRNNYRAYTIAGREVPSSGWVVRDGFYSLTIIDPDGVTLGGEQAGDHAPEGATMVFGEYNIEVLGPGNSGSNPADTEPIVIHFQSSSPIVTDENGRGFFICEIHHDDFGWGWLKELWPVKPPTMAFSTRTYATYSRSLVWATVTSWRNSYQFGEFSS